MADLPPMRERVCDAIIRQSALIADSVPSFAGMREVDLRWMYEQIGEAYIQDTKLSKFSISDLLKVYSNLDDKTSTVRYTGDPEIIDSQSSSDLELCERMRVVQAEAFEIANSEEAKK